MRRYAGTLSRQAELLLLDWIMPNGKKPMGDCTGQEVRQFGRKVAPWGRQDCREGEAGRNCARACLSETDVRKICGASVKCHPSTMPTAPS